MCIQLIWTDSRYHVFACVLAVNGEPLYVISLSLCHFIKKITGMPRFTFTALKKIWTCVRNNLTWQGSYLINFCRHQSATRLRAVRVISHLPSALENYIVREWYSCRRWCWIHGLWPLFMNTAIHKIGLSGPNVRPACIVAPPGRMAQLARLCSHSIYLGHVYSGCVVIPFT
jgi:hypothetical protein